VYYGGADPSAITSTFKNVDITATPDVIISVTEEFVKQFLKAKVALDETANFTVVNNSKGGVEFIFGYLTSNSSKIRISPVVDPIKNKLKNGLIFPLINIAEVFKSNTDMIDGAIIEIFR